MAYKQFTDLPRSVNVIERPDHPFVYDGPDFLLSESYNLSAVFTIRENEYHSPNKLLARVTNSLLAYPPNTLILLYIEQQDIPPLIENNLKYYFNRYIQKNETKHISRILSEKKEEKSIKDIKHWQRKTFSIQSQIQKDNLDYVESNSFDNKEINMSYLLKNRVRYFDKILQRHVTVKANIYEYENQYYGVKQLSNRTSDVEELKPYYEFSINKEFVVDNGVPCFNYLSRKALNVNEIPKVKYDPLKPIRIASLFGWHIVNSNNFSLVESRISKYK